MLLLLVQESTMASITPLRYSSRAMEGIPSTPSRASRARATTGQGTGSSREAMIGQCLAAMDGQILPTDSSSKVASFLSLFE